MPDELPLNIQGFEDRCRELLPRAVTEGFLGYHGHPQYGAVTENLDALKRIHLRSRVLAGVGQPSLNTTVLGQTIDFPVIIGPTGGPIWQICHPEAERAGIEAAGRMGTIMTPATNANYSIEEIADIATGPLWFQLYFLKDRALNKILVDRAEKAGYKALVVTVGNVTGGTVRRSKEDLQDMMLVINQRIGPTQQVKNLRGIDLPSVPPAGQFQSAYERKLAWSDLDWLRTITSLPIIVKGIQTAEDARLCVEHDLDGLVVSNHSGVDCSRGTIDSLAEVSHAVGGRIEILMDGGVRTGSDVLKALVLGARAVLIGRPALWGAAVGGTAGVCEVLTILKTELALAAGLCGVTDIQAIDRTLAVYPGSAL